MYIICIHHAIDIIDMAFDNSPFALVLLRDKLYGKHNPKLIVLY